MAGFNLKDVDVHTRKFIHSQFTKIVHEFYALPFGWKLYMYYGFADFNYASSFPPSPNRDFFKRQSSWQSQKDGTYSLLMSITRLSWVMWDLVEVRIVNSIPSN